MFRHSEILFVVGWHIGNQQRRLPPIFGFMVVGLIPLSAASYHLVETRPILDETYRCRDALSFATV